jgi:hypothetical protein
MGRSLSLARVSPDAKGAAAPADTAIRNKRRRVVESGMAGDEYRPEILRGLSVGDDTPNGDSTVELYPLRI